MKILVAVFVGLIEEVRVVISPAIAADPALGARDHALLVRSQIFNPDVGHALVGWRGIGNAFSVGRYGHRIMLGGRVKDRAWDQRDVLCQAGYGNDEENQNDSCKPATQQNTEK